MESYRSSHVLQQMFSLFLLAGLVSSESSNKMAPYLEQSFAFDYAPPTQDPPVPITEQCEVIHITWGREAFTTGPNPVAPYYLQIYTSAYIFPVVIPTGDPSVRSFDWAVPFAPGTQYQVCMFDSNGASGGCQRMYTVIPSRSVAEGSVPNCANLTFPASTLAIESLVNNGPLSQFGWIDSCSDISIRPLNGTPPFILSIAPTLHPVWNITSNDMAAINWTVQLSWAAPFFVSLVDSQGESWANGPLHSGQGKTECLSAISQKRNRVPESIAVGSGVGGLVLGTILGIFGTWFLLQKRRGRYVHFDSHSSTERIHSTGIPKGQGHALDGPAHSSHYSALPVDSQSSHAEGVPASPRSTQRSQHRLVSPGSGYEIEPFRLPLVPSETATAIDTVGSVHSQNTQLRDIHPMSPTSRSERSSETAAQRNTSHVYVVHHDGGRAPVTVYTPDGTEVIELPPRYTGGASREQNPVAPQQRVVDETPRKVLPTMPLGHNGGSGSGGR